VPAGAIDIRSGAGFVPRTQPAISLFDLTKGFDADDTRWHNEVYLERVHERYRELLVHYHDAATVNRTLFATELRNLPLYGYGAKGFTLSAIETAVELTQGKISAEEIRQLIVLGQEMLAQPVELLDGVAETLAELAGAYRLLVITKGDLHHQERKLAGSGLGLGLAISERIMRDFGGAMRARNAEGGGALFVIELPAADAALAEAG
jgi:putative hydrolase of the HAD superfamily